MSSSSARTVNDIEEGSPNNDDDTLGSLVHDDSSSRRMTEADADEAFALRLQNKLNSSSSGGGESCANNNQGGIEHIDENDTGPNHHPAAMFEDGKQKMGGGKTVESIEGIEHIDEDDTGPDHHPTAMFDDGKHKMVGSKKIEIEDDDDECPVPFNSADFEDGDLIAKKNKAKQLPTARMDEECIRAPRWEEIEEERPEFATTRIRNSFAARVNSYLSSSGGESSQNNTLHNMPTADQGVRITEAYLVEETSDDGEVVIATPALPWWKIKRVYLLPCTVFIIMAAVAIAVGVSQSGDKAVAAVMVPTTYAPSTSLAPSSPPSECVDKIITNAQELPIKEHFQTDIRNLKVAMDKENMIIVAQAQDGSSDLVIVMFYELRSNGWERSDAHVVDDLIGTYPYEVAISGKTAFIGFPESNNNMGKLYHYEKNQFDEWQRIERAFTDWDETTTTSDCSWGLGVEIDKDLACMQDYNIAERGINGLIPTQYQEMNVQFQEISLQ